MLDYYQLQTLGPLEKIVYIVFRIVKMIFITVHVTSQEVFIAFQLFMLIFSLSCLLRFSWSVQHNNVAATCFLLPVTHLELTSEALFWGSWVGSTLLQNPLRKVLRIKVETQIKNLYGKDYLKGNFCHKVQIIMKMFAWVRNGDQIKWLQLFLLTLGLSLTYLQRKEEKNAKKTCKCNYF